MRTVKKNPSLFAYETIQNGNGHKRLCEMDLKPVSIRSHGSYGSEKKRTFHKGSTAKVLKKQLRTAADGHVILRRETNASSN